MKKNKFLVPLRRDLKKLLLTMKLCLLFLMISTVTLLANSSYSQSTLLSVQIKDGTFRDLIEEIEAQSEFIFVFTKGSIDLDKRLSVSASGQKVEKILDEVLKSMNASYRIFDRQIAIGVEDKDGNLILPAIFSNVSEQPKTRQIEGRVIDSKGDGIPGCAVMVKGTTVGMITDAEGKFSLTIPLDAKILTFSFIGFESQEINIGNKSSINVSLKEMTVGLDEVVAVGYGIQKKVTITGAVTQVKGAELLKSPVPNLSTALVGRTSGVMAVQNSGQPGADDVTLRIRGIGTLSNSSASPLVLVDGIERSFNQLDPNEIESISILKDASSTAVYGIRGANGVIIVTTKKGKEGKAEVSYSGNFSLQTPTRLPDFLDGYTFAKLYNEALVNDNPLTTLTFTNEELQKFKDQSDPLFYPNTDWLKLLMKDNAPQTQHNININGGTKVAKYFVSVGYLNQLGLFNEFESASGVSNNSSFNRYNFRSNIDINITPSTLVNFHSGGYTSVRRSAKGTEQGLSVPLFSRIFDSAPISTVGIWEGKIITLDRSGNRNIIAESLANGFVDYIDNNLNLNLGINQKLDMLTKGLSVRGKIAYDNFYTRQRIFTINVATYTPIRVTDENGVETTVLRQNGEKADVVSDPMTSFSRMRQFYLDFAAEYNNSFGKHNLGALVLYNQKKRYYHTSSYPGIPLGYQDWVGRVTYNYALKYMLEFNIGRNGSENFPVNNRFGWFPALSAGWVITEEPFIGKLIDKNTLSYLKLRLSYGEVGNDIMGSARFLYFPGEYTSGNYGYFGEDPVSYTSYVEGKLGNPKVTWEKSKKLDVALDMKLFKDQLSLTADYFNERRNNILTSRKTVPNYVAVTLQDAYNIGEVDNHGFEIEAGWNSKINKFDYWVNGNFSFARNKIIFMDEATNLNYPNLNATGHRVGERFGYVFDGFFNTQDEVLMAPLYFGKRPSLGDTKYKDITGDGVIDQNDQQVILNPAFPEISYGFSFGFSYKGFDFSTLFQGATNYSVVVRDRLYQPFATFGSALDIIENRWHADSPDNNANATFPKLSVGYGNPQNYYTSTLNTKDATYLRLKNVEFGYTFDKSALHKLQISGLRLFISGQNLYTWDKLKIIDPEGDPSANMKYPQLKVYNVGCKVNF